MKSIKGVLVGGIALVAIVMTVWNVAQRAASDGVGGSTHSTEWTKAERGKYIVYELAKCNDCHSPRNETGAFIEERQLTGSPLGFAPTVPMPWMPVAPKIAGLPVGYTEADMVHFLMTGERPGGRPEALPPMPNYRLKRDDAEAVAAYLHSLN